MTADGKVSKTMAACTKSATSTTSGWLGRESRKIYEETGASRTRTKSSSRGSFPSERFDKTHPSRLEEKEKKKKGKDVLSSSRFPRRKRSFEREGEKKKTTRRHYFIR